MSTPPRRNDQCPCGSGRRFKDCHGKLAGDAPEAQPPRIGALVDGALRLHRQGRVDEAAAIYRQVLEREPGNTIAIHYLGMAAWHRGDIAAAETQMRASIDADGSVPDFHNNLGLLLRDTGRVDAAIACYRQALTVDPEWIEAFSNLGLALESAGRFDEAIDAYREAIARQPGFAAARQNLARALLTRGDFREGWEQYRWRLLAQGVATSPPDRGRARLPAKLDGRCFTLHGEQGLGDVIFFLRFAPELARRGARLAFAGDARLIPLLARTGLFPLGLAHTAMQDSAAEEIFVGDLPWLLQADHPAAFPPPFPLTALAERVARLGSLLQGFGPRPWIALTWRAGLQSTGPVKLQLKEIAPATFGERLRGTQATWISLQRLPRAGEREALEESLAGTVHDLSAANADLEEALALLALVDGYVGVSNANTHLRGGLGGASTVLVPHPPEWRWGLHGDRSPWFPGAQVQRQASDGTWPSHRR